MKLRKTVYPRIFSISETLANMLSTLRRKTEYVFGSNSETTRSPALYNERRRIPHKLGNPRILKIGLHTFRHWKATMLYH